MTTSTQALTLAREALREHTLPAAMAALDEAWRLYGGYPRDGLGRKITAAERDATEVETALAAIDAHLASQPADDDTRPMGPATVDLSRLERIVSDSPQPAAVGALEAVAEVGDLLLEKRQRVMDAHGPVNREPLCLMRDAQAKIAEMALQALSDDGQWIEHTGELQAQVAALTEDRDSWIAQASARTADAVKYATERDEALARVAELERDREWRPMETAPKDRSVLAWCVEPDPADYGTEAEQTFSAIKFHLSPVKPGMNVVHWVPSQGDDECEAAWWFRFDDWDETPAYPAYWMPLPLAPADAARQDSGGAR